MQGMTLRKPWPLPAALLLILCLLPACPATPPPADALTPALDRILDAPALRGGVTGAVVVRVRDGAVLYSHSPDVRLLPASNRKLFTAAAALAALGDDFRFVTQVRATALPNANGELSGSLVLRGAGDGALTVSDLEDLAAQVARAGVRRVTGGVAGDGTLFSDGPYGFGWEWDDLSDEEFPQISALEVAHGDVRVRVTAARAPGQPAQVALTPDIGFPPVVVSARTVAAGGANTCAVVCPYDQSFVRVSGDLPLGKTLEQNVPVARPSHYAALVFADALRRRGVVVEGQTIEGDVLGAAGVVLATHASLPLSQYLPVMMKPSDNLIAESLVRTLGVVRGGGLGTYAAGHAVETPCFQALGVDTTALDLRDGCGVSRRDFVTARAITQLLRGMAGRPDWRFFYDSLPVAGVDGTLKSRMAGTRAAGNVHAKTGTLSQVRCLSGYLTARNGDLYVFSLLMNNFPGDAKSAGAVQDAFVERLADALLKTSIFLSQHCWGLWHNGQERNQLHSAPGENHVHVRPNVWVRA